MNIQVQGRAEALDQRDRAGAGGFLRVAGLPDQVEQNFITKSGAQRYAAEHGIIIVAPDTSPRGKDVPDDDAYDLGQGAGFYINATQAPWDRHYRMYDYVVEELPRLIESNFPAAEARAVSGHSMGGHGALIIALAAKPLGRS